MLNPLLEIIKTTVNRCNPLLVQRAGHHRKPRWLPVAKRRIFYIPPKPKTPKEDAMELQRLHNNHKTKMRAIRRFYTEELLREQRSQQSATSEEMKRLEAEEWARCEALNASWNAAVGEAREHRRRQQQLQVQEQALARMDAADADLRRRRERAAQLIAEQKELSKSFVTPENLDAAIEYAMANPISYNFTIDLRGKRYTDTPATDPTASLKSPQTEEMQTTSP